MGHHISAVLLKGPFDEHRATSFDLKVIRLTPEITLFPLYAEYCDYWSDKLGISGHMSHRPLLNSNVIHHMMNAIAEQPLFAVVEIDYFGGCGSQAAAVYRGWNEIMSPTETQEGTGPKSVGPINQALRQLGTVACDGYDEFDTVGLGWYRDFDDLFEKYWDAT